MFTKDELNSDVVVPIGLFFCEVRKELHLFVIDARCEDPWCLDGILEVPGSDSEAVDLANGAKVPAWELLEDPGVTSEDSMNDPDGDVEDPDVVVEEADIDDDVDDPAFAELAATRNQCQSLLQIDTLRVSALYSSAVSEKSKVLWGQSCFEYQKS